jgi:hypothetical protein
MIISVVLVAALAAPLGAAALTTSFTGHSGVALGVKGQHKKRIGAFSVDPNVEVPLQCDEGATTTHGIPVAWSWRGAEQPKIKAGRFRLQFTRELKFQVLDDGGYIVSTSHGEFLVKAHGRFNDDFKKASGTLTMSGDAPGPATPPYYEPPHFHHCKSATVNWKVHRGFLGRQRGTATPSG